MAANPNMDITEIRRELTETKLALELAQAQIMFETTRAIANKNHAIAMTNIDNEVTILALRQTNIDLHKQIDDLMATNQKLTREKITAENALQAIRVNMQMGDVQNTNVPANK
jgi:(p)ppGpp synthase/HD superfamily hydrolase